MIIYVYEIFKFVFNNRVDRHKEYFGLSNSFSLGNGKFFTYWNVNIYHETYNNMF